MLPPVTVRMLGGEPRKALEDCDSPPASGRACLTGLRAEATGPGPLGEGNGGQAGAWLWRWKTWPDSGHLLKLTHVVCDRRAEVKAGFGVWAPTAQRRA